MGLTALLLAFAVAPAAAQVESHSVAKTTIVTVTAGKPTELSFTLSTRNVPAGKVTFKVTNKGVATHSFEICTTPKTGTAYPNSCVGVKTKILPPGQSDTISVTLKKGIYEYLCTVPGHANAGMKGSFGVGQKTAPPTLAPPKVLTPTVTSLSATSSCPSPQATTVNVSEFEYGFTLTDTSGNPLSSVPCGTVTFDMTNNGTIVHNFDISYAVSAPADTGGEGIGPFLQPGATATMAYVMTPGIYAYQCDVPEHADLGMVGSLTVTDG